MFVEPNSEAAGDQGADALDFKYKLGSGSGLDVTSELASLRWYCTDRDSSMASMDKLHTALGRT